MKLKKLLSTVLASAFIFSICGTAMPVYTSAESLSSDPGYANVALNKTYIASEPFAQNGTVTHPDENGVTMTDGKIPDASASNSDAGFMGFNKTADNVANGYSSITVDLGGFYKLDKLVAYTVSDKYYSAGTPAPEFVYIYLSNDNENWYKAGRAFPDSDTSKTTVASTLTLDTALTARYVQYRFVSQLNWMLVAEVEAYGIKTDYAAAYPEPAPETSIMLVGNSNTFFFNAPVKLLYFADEAGLNLDVTYCTVGGAYLHQYADETNTNHGALIRSKLAEKQYDIVALQDNNYSSYNESKAAIDILAPMIEENGAELVLYKRYSPHPEQDGFMKESYKHHYSYTKLASDFNVSKLAPVADAFVIAREKYPEISIMYTDDIHHNDAGAYLIACVWAISYLGIDISNSSFCGRLSESDAAKLRECAILACETGYDFKGPTYVENGTTYYDVAKDKDYTVLGTPYTGDWTDTDSNGNPYGKLTDSIIASFAEDYAIGAYSGTAVTFTIDLEKYYNIKSVYTDMYGGKWGIADPAGNTVKVEISTDGSTYTNLGNAEMSAESVTDNWKRREFNLVTNQASLPARYVRVTYSNTANTSVFYWSSDICVFGDESDYDGGSTVVPDDNKLEIDSYTSPEANRYFPNWAPWNENPGFSYDDGIKLTDGVKEKLGWNDAMAAWYYSDAGSLELIFDLKSYSKVESLQAHFVKYASHGTPSKVSVAYTTDGSNYTVHETAGVYSEVIPVGVADAAMSAYKYTIDFASPVEAQYIKVIIEFTSSAMIICEEVEIFGQVYDPSQNDREPLVIDRYTSTNDSIWVFWDDTVDPSDDGIKLTDGIKNTGVLGNDIVGWFYNQQSAGGNIEFVLELESISNIDTIIGYFYHYAPDTYAGAENFRVSYSPDGIDYTDISADAQNTRLDDVQDGYTYTWTVALDTAVKAKYVKITIVNTNMTLVICDELEVYGTEATDDPVIPKPNIVLGDVNNDSIVDSTDYLLVKRSCFGTYTLSLEEKERANVDQNNDINSIDYVLIKRIVFGTYTAQ